MDLQSPPKRMTRARAAAKTGEPTTRSTRVVSARTKPQAAPSTGTAAATTKTATKRKSPCDEDEEHEHEMQPAKKITAVAAKSTRGRGRPKKVSVEESAPEQAPEQAPPTTARSRGRPRKIAEPATQNPPKPTRATRTTKKAVPEEPELATEPVKKTTRGRPAFSASATTSIATSLTKSAARKTVTFEEPEKENIAPPAEPARKTSTKASAPASTTGLRGKPVRKAASATVRRAARTITKAAGGTADPSDKVEKPMPLSPKKVNQLTLNRVESDDELGMDDKVPVRRFKKLPIKPAMNGPKAASMAKAAAVTAINDENATAASLPETTVNSMLATPAKRLPPSPWKGSITSPAKRVEGLVLFSVPEGDDQTSQGPSKIGLLQSPAKRQPLTLNPPGADAINGSGFSPAKLPLLSSPAKRPPLSPIKPLPKAVEEEQTIHRTPAPKATLLASPLPEIASDNTEAEQRAAEANAVDAQTDHEAISETPARLSFPGRLSAVMPRHADPALTPPTLAGSEEIMQSATQQKFVEDAGEKGGMERSGEPTVLDKPSVESPLVESASTTPPSSPPKTANPMFGLRDHDLYPQDASSESESEDESPVRQGRFTPAFSGLPATPCPGPAKFANVMPPASRSTAKARSRNKFGFTPLAQQLGGWKAGSSPMQPGPDTAAAARSSEPVSQEQPAPPAAEATSTLTGPVQNSFFDDEMLVRPNAMELEEDATTVIEADEDLVLQDVSFTEEDMELAAEANEMSLVEREADHPNGQDLDDSVSEASQEYADENAIPIDPALLARNGTQAPAVPPVTPQRGIHREFHTVAKVPLKPADETTPRPQSERRSYSASRLPVTRSSGRLSRNATASSRSLSKDGDAKVLEDDAEEHTDPVLLVTPQKSDIWSTIGTPARTPRRDLNPALLRGAVVFVDVHTSEGADASSIFVELLTQMGARCVKTWSWSPNTSSEAGSDSRVGITHVVYKDGGKRTLEKVRKSGGVVQCVGVSWVLDCERENQWLDEAPYLIDTSLVPRGGARRRKSMEPRAIANQNGTLVPSPTRNSSRGSHTAQNTPASNRRESSLWTLSPSKSHADEADDDDRDAEGEEDDADWPTLSPVPKTPAPEAIARFVADVSPGATSPSNVGNVESEDPLPGDGGSGGGGEELLLRTCPPPKRTTFVEPDEGILCKEKDQGLLMRLMAARRKSLQFAPKVGSPLARAWKAVD
ncbi:hypothetical protein N658DRAFT_427095 [Parathielavia hyrcaniae]|uniref:BRCT domain-containing protein n=1 Tax=Parathielavia hyrcaniae TaxID=113614 RepID=A0AAN6PZF8_9PEZI|nr:hypothetical protein N658DRAFT_427095 [Parathielavia hyrcaniae]